MLTVRGKQYRDLDRNGRLDPYEDWRLSPEQRTDDLVRRMTLEKPGTMMHALLPGAGSGANASIGVSADGYDLTRVGEMTGQRDITSFITRLALSPRRFAEANKRRNSSNVITLLYRSIKNLYFTDRLSS